MTEDEIDAFIRPGSICNVACSEHAALRAVQRLGFPLAGARDLVQDEVRAGFAEGRWSRMPPKWLNGSEATPRVRYVSRPDDAEAVYVVRLKRRCWRVVTCITEAHDFRGTAHYHFPRIWAGRNDESEHVFSDGSEPWHRYGKAERRASLRSLIGMMRREKEETCSS